MTKTIMAVAAVLLAGVAGLNLVPTPARSIERLALGLQSPASYVGPAETAIGFGSSDGLARTAGTALGAGRRDGRRGAVILSIGAISSDG